MSSTQSTSGEEADLMDSDFNEKRWLIEQLKVEATLTIENGKRIAYAKCKLLGEEEPLLLASSTFHKSVLH